MLRLTLLLLFLFITPRALLHAQKKSVTPVPAAPIKGLLSEIRLDEENEQLNLKKTFQSEVLIIHSENKAIETLKSILKKKAGTLEEPDLLFRLAELHMRRSKSGRFFDLNQDSQKQLRQLGLTPETAQKSLREAVRVYEQISNRFSHYPELDAVFFNMALAHSQLGQSEKSLQYYTLLIQKFPNSSLVPDALLEAGEIDYQKQRFAKALTQFKEIERYPKSKAFPYGLYKSAWAHYNLKQTEPAISQLLQVLKTQLGQNPKYNLRPESLRDLTLFVGESLAPDDVLPFFVKITTPDELGTIMLNLASLYESHSRHKEMSVFADKFIDRYPENASTPALYVKLIETHETLKNRDTVIKKMKAMSDFCRNRNKKEDCLEPFKKISLEISQKWWDIWLKNKAHTEFSQLTEKSFEILLSLDQQDRPDSTSRYAYAELLFQLKKFEQSAVQYEQVSLHKTADNDLKHKALYGALYSLEKMIEKSDNRDLVERQKSLALRYRSDYPKGEHFAALTFKLATITYKQSLYDESLQYLAELSKFKLPESDRTQAQDIILDIYNIKKDYVTLIEQINTMLALKPPAVRLQQLETLQQQTRYALIQADAEKKDKKNLIDELVQFSRDYNGNELARSSLWQAISVAYSQGLDFKGAELSEQFALDYADDKRKVDALKEASRVYIESAHFEHAIRVLEKLTAHDPAQNSIYKQSVCELLNLLMQKTKTRSCYTQLIQSASLAQRTVLVQDYLNTFMDSEKTTSDYQKLQKDILQWNIEPYATQALIEKAQQLLEQGKKQEAFQLSLRINSRPTPEGTRAGARLIQAQILEEEFREQSLKASLERLSMVIALKTEKFDKSMTAFSSALKMSDSPDIQKRALMGIDRLYSHYIQGLKNIELPETLSTADRKSVQEELNTLIKPLSEKHESHQQKLAELKEMQEDIKTSLFNPTGLNHYMMTSDKGLYEEVRSHGSKCNAAEISFSSAYNCAQTHNWSSVDRILLSLAENKSQRPLALYNLSVSALLQGDRPRAQWLIDRCLSINHELHLAHYQKARLVYPIVGLQYYFQNYEKIFDKDLNIPERYLISGLKAFSERDFQMASKEFSRLNRQQNDNYGVAPIIELINKNSSQLTSNVGGQ